MLVSNPAPITDTTTAPLMQDQLDSKVSPGRLEEALASIRAETEPDSRLSALLWIFKAGRHCAMGIAATSVLVGTGSIITGTVLLVRGDDRDSALVALAGGVGLIASAAVSLISLRLERESAERRNVAFV